MGGYPLPALHLNPPQPSEGPLDAYGKLLQYKNMALQNQAHQQAVQQGQLEIQQKQRALQDQNTIMEAQAAAQGDPKKWLPAIQGKVSPQTWMALTKSDAETRDQLAKADQSELAVMKDKNDRFIALLNQAKAMPPEQYQQAFPQILQAAEEIHPGSVAKLGLNPQQPIPQEKLSLFGVGLQTQEQYIKQAQEEAAAKKRPFEQQKAEADAAKAGSEATQEGMKADAMKQFGGLSPEMQKSRYLSIQTKLNGGMKVSPDDQAFKKAYEQEKAITPTATFNLQNAGAPAGINDPIVQGVASGKMKIGDVLTARTPIEVRKQFLSSVLQVNPNFNSGDYDIEKGMSKYMTSGAGGKQLTAFNTAMTHLDTLDRLAAGLNNSNIQVFNKAAQAWAEQTGSAAPANFAAAKNAMSGEVAAALKASGATDQEITHVGSTFDKAQSPAQLKGAINTYRELLRGKRDQLKQQFEAGKNNAVPNFGTEKPATAASERPVYVNGKLVGYTADGKTMRPAQ